MITVFSLLSLATFSNSILYFPGPAFYNAAFSVPRFSVLHIPPGLR